jgi:hypothetical protein
MLVTSALIPAAASWHTLRGLVQHRHVPAWHGLPELVLFDRDGTLVHNVTRPSELADATDVAPDLPAAVRLIMGGTWRPRG